MSGRKAGEPDGDYESVKMGQGEAELRPSGQVVRLRGRACAEPSTCAPISGTRSAYWEAEIWDTRYFRNRLPAIKQKSKSRVLWIEDGSGRVPVLLHGVEWKFHDELSIPSGKGAPERAQAFAAGHGYDWGSGHIRAVERCLAEGADLNVCGTVSAAGEVAAALERSQQSPVAGLVAWLESMKEGQRSVAQPFDLAAVVRQRFRENENIVWCGRRGLVIGAVRRPGPESLSNR